VRRIHEQHERADRLRQLVEALDEQTARDEHMLSELQGVLGLAPQLRIEELSSGYEVRGCGKSRSRCSAEAAGARRRSTTASGTTCCGRLEIM
jgi:hypothetical protein